MTSKSNTNNSKQALWISISSFFSFLVGIIGPMILSRYFDKSDYGTYKQVMYVYTTLLTVFTLGLPKAYSYFIPKSDVTEQKSLINKITKIFLVLGTVFSVFLFVCSEPIADVLKNPDLSYALRVFSPVPLLLLPTLGIDGIYASFKKTQYLIIYHLSTKVLIILFSVLPVILMRGTYIQALVGFDIASLITCILALYMKSKPVPQCTHLVTKVTYKEIFNFSLPLLMASIWGIIIKSSNQFFISRYYGNEEFANFSNGFMELPIVGMIISAVSAVLLPVFSKQDQGGGMTQDSLNTWNASLNKTSKIIFPMLVFCIVFAELMMTCMYGDLYSSSTIYFQIKNFSGLFYIIPFAPIILALGKTKAYANVHMAMAILMVCLDIIVCNVFSSPVPVAVVSESCQILKIYILLIIVANYAKKTVWGLLPINNLLRVLIASLLSGLCTKLLISYFELNKFVVLFSCFIVYIFIYYLLCWLMKITYQDILRSFVKVKNEKILKIIP